MTSQFTLKRAKIPTSRTRVLVSAAQWSLKWILNCTVSEIYEP